MYIIPKMKSVTKNRDPVQALNLTAPNLFENEPETTKWLTQPIPLAHRSATT